MRFVFCSLLTLLLWNSVGVVHAAELVEIPNRWLLQTRYELVESEDGELAGRFTNKRFTIEGDPLGKHWHVQELPNGAISFRHFAVRDLKITASFFDHSLLGDDDALLPSQLHEGFLANYENNDFIVFELYNSSFRSLNKYFGVILGFDNFSYIDYFYGDLNFSKHRRTFFAFYALPTSISVAAITIECTPGTNYFGVLDEFYSFLFSNFVKRTG